MQKTSRLTSSEAKACPDLVERRHLGPLHPPAIAPSTRKRLAARWYRLRQRRIRRIERQIHSAGEEPEVRLAAAA